MPPWLSDNDAKREKCMEHKTQFMKNASFLHDCSTTVGTVVCLGVDAVVVSYQRSDLLADQ
jgi:hypothetical protein